MKIYVGYQKGFDNSDIVYYVGESLEKAQRDCRYIEIWQDGNIVGCYVPLGDGWKLVAD